MKRSHFTQKAKGFSLVELLVVIAIIAVLAGIAYPVITGQIAKAKITEGKKVASDLVVSIEQFEAKYDYLPYSSGSSPDGIVRYSTENDGLLRTLMGLDDEINPNNTQFFEYKAAKNGVNGIVFTGGGDTPQSLLDPWGNAYVVAIDYTGDREIDLAQISEFSEYKDQDGQPLTVYSKAAVVASPGPDGEFNDLKDVKTW